MEIISKTITFIIGHRGVGKSTFLSKIPIESDSKIDLDYFIQKIEDLDIGEIINTKGIEYFRSIEIKYLKLILKKERKVNYIALGAGFSIDPRLCLDVNQSGRILWIMRDSDLSYRIFNQKHRPRLIKSVSAKEEFIQLRDKREIFFKSLKAFTLTLAEGSFYTDIFFNPNLNCELTILPDCAGLEYDLGYRHFELRDDLLSEDQLDSFIKKFPKEKILYSLRKKEYEKLRIGIDEFKIDYAVECSGFAPVKIYSLSQHEKIDKNENIQEFIYRLENHVMASNATVLKISYDLNNFEDLIYGHQWYLKNPARNVFLPRHIRHGRWYRELIGPHMALNFLRLGRKKEIAPDWPIAMCIHLKNYDWREFACVLGEPIEHSLTPLFHRDFFSNYKMNTLAISMNEAELNKENLNFLFVLGLRFTAITSPLKIKAYELLSAWKDHPVKMGLNAKKLQSVNTLIFKSGIIYADNTDIDGFSLVLKKINFSINYKCYIWGGGGTLAMIKELIHEALHFSTRIEDSKLLDYSTPDVVIWAAGNSKDSKIKFPPKHWKPKIIIDLNYNQDSHGLEYSLINPDAQYISGIDLFEAQAHFQQQLFCSL